MRAVGLSFAWLGLEAFRPVSSAAGDYPQGPFSAEHLKQASAASLLSWPELAEDQRNLALGQIAQAGQRNLALGQIAQAGDRPQGLLLAQQGCDTACLIDGGNYGCKSRVDWLHRKDKVPLAAALAQVNTQCQGQCSCGPVDFTQAEDKDPNKALQEAISKIKSEELPPATTTRAALLGALLGGPRTTVALPWTSVAPAGGKGNFLHSAESIVTSSARTTTTASFESTVTTSATRTTTTATTTQTSTSSATRTTISVTITTTTASSTSTVTVGLGPFAAHEDRYHCAVCRDVLSGAPCSRFDCCDDFSKSIIEEDKCASVCPDHTQQDTLPELTDRRQLELRVSKGFGTKGYDQLRISVITISENPPVQDFFDYSAPFQRRWLQYYLHTSMKTVRPGIDEAFFLGRDVSVKLPKQGAGIAGLLISDPCVSSSLNFVRCDFGHQHKTMERIPALINAFAGDVGTDFWSLAGDNFYDRTGQLTGEVYGRISLKAKSKIFMAAPGNHDFWAYGSPDWGTMYDQCGYGFMQYYAADTKAAEDVGVGSHAQPFDFSINPLEGRFTYHLEGQKDQNWTMGCNLPKATNFLWYHQIGNVGFIGQSGAHDLKDTRPFMKEACAWVAEQHGLEVVVLFGHWDEQNLGAADQMSMPDWYVEMAAMQGCSEFADRKLLKFVMGHTHCNDPYPHPGSDIAAGFRVAGFGMAGCGDFGIPVFDSTNNSVRLWYFDTSDEVKYQDVIECVEKKGWRACTHLAVLWLDQPIDGPQAAAVEDSEDSGAHADLITSAATAAAAAAAERAPETSMPAPEWACYDYMGNQGDDWCQSVGVLDGMEYKYFGEFGHCGECWCCKRPATPQISAAAAPEADASADSVLPMAEWACHYYVDKQDDEWCRSAGIQDGTEYRFFGEVDHCGQCACCERQVP